MKIKLDTDPTCPFCDAKIKMSSRIKNDLTVNIHIPDPLSWVPRRNIPTPYPVCESCYMRYHNGESLPFTEQFVKQVSEYTKIIRYLYLCKEASESLAETEYFEHTVIEEDQT